MPIIAFKDAFRDLLERNGGLGGENLDNISEKLRQHSDTFSVGRIRGLLVGHPPTQEERKAIFLVLDSESDRELPEDGYSRNTVGRRLAEFAFSNCKSPVLGIEHANKFPLFVKEETSFRNQNLTEEEMKTLYSEFLPIQQSEDEIELFGLPV